ncbi:hypothetical protein ROLI_041520 [Roseobacter fucihabitans]|uniref:Uncharacterized protein n=1 Tax=Roseobacter fucihabitans TaxID=1537242 RepID=A0ABZ2BZ24_9RHOB|nr:hypothetical protein [Roseobacter litoralis]
MRNPYGTTTQNHMRRAMTSARDISHVVKKHLTIRYNKETQRLFLF